MHAEFHLSRHQPSAPLSTDSAFSWRRLSFATLLGLASNASMWTSVSLMPSLQAHFELSRTNASWPYIMIIAGFLVATPVFGRLSDRFGIAIVLFFAFVLSGMSYIAGAHAPNFPLFLLSQIGVGVGTCVGFAPLIADTSHWFRKHRGIALAIVSSSAYFSGILWSTIIARILAHGHWQQASSTVGIVLLIAAPAAILLRTRVPEHFLVAADLASTQQLRTSALSAKQIQRILMLAGIGCCVAMAMPQVHIISLCLDLGFTIAQGSELLTIILVGGIISRLVCGALSDRIGPVRILLIGSALQLLALLLYIPFDGLMSLYVVSLIFGLAQGGILPSYPMIVRQYLPARRAGAAIGSVSTATQFGMAFGGWLSGWIFDQSGSYFLAFLNGAVWNCLNLLLVWFLIRNADDGPPKSTLADGQNMAGEMA